MNNKLKMRIEDKVRLPNDIELLIRNLNSLRIFFKELRADECENKYEGQLSLGTLRLMRILVERLDKEKSLLPTFTSESVDND